MTPPDGRPAPFIVGAPRSGTTLLRLMLDSHPDLAIPAETGFFLTLATSQEEGRFPVAAEELWRLFTGSPTWPDLGIEAPLYGEALASLTPFSVAAGLRAFYRLYAAKHGKSAWGDKSPLHCYHLPLVQEMLPEAHILHVIRDGRDVALSLREVWFSPGHEPAVLADFWARAVQAGRAGGAQCRHYLEVRFEDLVSQPQATLRAICDFLELPFDEAMLGYHRNASTRLREATGRRLDDGTVVTIEQRLQQQRLTSFPPDPQRIERWRSELSPHELREFEAEAGSLLAELGYASPPSTRPPSVSAEAGDGLESRT